MDFERFVQLLDSATLWFSRADKFTDRFELKRLVQSVVISPTANAWFPDLVSSIMRRYGITGIPVTSQLNEEPTW